MSGVWLIAVALLGADEWAFRKPVAVAAPEVRDVAWPRGAVDRFVLAQLEREGLRPNGEAGKGDWLRRVTFGLIGLPPTPDEVAAFASDATSQAESRVVERLLADPRHGERWARHWLDVARYAEDRALATAQESPHAWRYRDWVVQAFNRDLPYDQFVRLQLAGDLLKEPADDYFLRLGGLGFQGLGQLYHRGNFAEQVMADELDDRIDTVTRGLLGLTVACARCHDHKYDPIPTRDYYSLGAAYQGSSLSVLPIASPAEVERHAKFAEQVKQREKVLNDWLAEQAKRLGVAAKDALAKLDAEAAEEHRKRKAEVEAFRATGPAAPPQVHAVSGGGQGMKVHLRGSVERKGDEAPPGFLEVLRKGERGKAFTRLDLADAIASPDNPLTARVIVNRVWHQHFGRGIVATPSNFGNLGDAPTHPELLDWLAVRFVENGWSLKWLHRQIVLSRTYRLSSANRTNADPENRFLWRWTPRRLDFEGWRDAVLAVSGRLERTQGGPSKAVDQHARRTIYSRISRSRLDPTLAVFDFPDANVSAEKRTTTTVAQQQLFVLNSAFMADGARAFAARLTGDDPARIAQAYRLAYGRDPGAAERDIGLRFLAAAKSDEKLSPWEQYAQALLASNEFTWLP